MIEVWRCLYLKQTQKAIIEILEYIVYLTELAPCILCLFLLKSVKAKEFKVFFWYLCSFSFFLLLLLFFGLVIHKPSFSLVVSRLYPILECSFLSLFYLILIRSKIKKWVLLPFTIFLAILFVFDFIVNKAKPSFLPLAIEGFFYIVVILFYFFEKIKFINDTPIYSLASFWVSIALLINFSGTFFLYLFSISMIKDPAFRDQYHIIYGFITIIKNALLCAAVIVNRSLQNNQSNIPVASNIDLGKFYPLNKNTNPKPQWSFYRQQPGPLPDRIT